MVERANAWMGSCRSLPDRFDTTASEMNEGWILSILNGSKKPVRPNRQTVLTNLNDILPTYRRFNKMYPTADSVFP